MRMTWSPTPSHTRPGMIRAKARWHVSHVQTSTTCDTLGIEHPFDPQGPQRTPGPDNRTRQKDPTEGPDARTGTDNIPIEKAVRTPGHNRVTPQQSSPLGPDSCLAPHGPN